MNKKILFNIILFLFSYNLQAKNDTPDFYRCEGKVGGEWAFGRGPNGCNASSFGEDRFIAETYPTAIFQDNADDRVFERKRYMEELHAIVRDAAEYYIKKRKPNVSPDEIEAWKTGIFAMANQESFWSHYRVASDKRLKLMRGDVGHGHGLLQVDDRYHFPAVQNGTAWNLLGNITYSFDEYFTAWERAPSQSCVKSATNYTARIRSAWAAYNGGPAKICRWTNPNDTWARNDKGFAEKLASKSWQTFVGDSRKPASINVACLLEKNENCSAIPHDPTQELREAVLYQSNEGAACVIKSATMYCLPQTRDSICLQAISPFSNSVPLTLPENKLTLKMLDRHITCSAFDESLIPVGKMLQLNTAINLRSSPAGGLVSLLPKGEVAEVLDFEIRGLGENNRYYKINVEGKIGFIYGGNKSDFQKWAQISAMATPLSSLIARSGESIQIKNPAGINLRANPGGTLIRNVPTGTKLSVLDYVIRGTENFVYYRVNYMGKTGFLYAGQILPDNSLATWAERLK